MPELTRTLVKVGTLTAGTIMLGGPLGALAGIFAGSALSGLLGSMLIGASTTSANVGANLLTDYIQNLGRRREAKFNHDLARAVVKAIEEALRESLQEMQNAGSQIAGENERLLKFWIDKLQKAQRDESLLLELFQPGDADAHPNDARLVTALNDEEQLKQLLWDALRDTLLRWAQAESRLPANEVTCSLMLDVLKDRLLDKFRIHFGAALKNNPRAMTGFLYEVSLHTTEILHQLPEQVGDLQADIQAEFREMRQRLSTLQEDFNSLHRLGALFADSLQGIQTANEALQTLAQRMRLMTEYPAIEAADLIQDRIREMGTLVVGREQEIQALKEFVARNGSGVKVVTAPAGYGKSSLLAHWVLNSGAETGFFVYHFFSVNANATSSLIQAHRNLLRQLYLYHGLEGEPIPDDKERLRETLYEVIFGREARAGEPLIILLDAIDEAADEFEQFHRDLPAGVYCIVSGRAEEEETPAYLEKWLRKGRRYPLQSLTQDALAEWLQRAGDGELKIYTADAAFVREVYEKTKGYPLHLRYLMEDLLDAHSKGRNVREVLRCAPQGFAAYVKEQYLQIRALLDKEGRPRLIDVFCLLAVAKGPLTSEDLSDEQLLGDYPRSADSRVLRWFRIRDRDGDLFYSFEHPKIAEAFRGLSEIKTHTKRLHQKLMNYCEAFKYERIYPLRFYPNHLLESPETYVRLTELLTDFRFVGAKVQKGMLYDLIRDYNSAKKTNLTSTILGAWSSFINIESHILDKHPELFFQQAFNQPDDSPVCQAASAVLRDVPQSPLLPKTYLRWLNKPDKTIPSPLLRTFQGHRKKVTSVACTPDGTRVVSGGEDGTVRVWDLETGQEVLRLEGHTGEVVAIAVTPDGTRAVLGGENGTVRVLDLASGQEVRRLEGHTDRVFAVAFLPDGMHAVSGSDDGTVRVWDVELGQEIDRLEAPHSYFTAVALSPDGTQVVCGAWDEHIHVWDFATGVMSFVIPPKEVSMLAFSPDDQRILVGSSGGTFFKLNKNMKSYYRSTLEKQKNTVSLLAFSADGKYAVSGSEDGTLLVWDIESSFWVIRRLKGHTDAVRAVEFSQDGSRVVSVGGDGNLLVWMVASGQEVSRLEEHTDGVRSIAITPDGKQIVMGIDDGTIRVWDLTLGSEVKHLEGHIGEVFVISVSPDGKLAVSGGDDGTVFVWELESLRAIKCLRGHTDAIKAVAFSPDGMQVISGSWDKTVRVWDIDSGQEIKRMKGHTGDVPILAFSPDRMRAVWGSKDGTVRLWDLATGRKFRRWKIPPSEITALAFSNDGMHVVLGSEDGTIRTWDLASGQEVLQLEGHTDKINSVAIVAGGTQVVSWSDDGTIRMWGLASGREVGRFEGPTMVTAMAVSRDGRRVVSGSYDGTVRVWDIASGQKVRRMEGLDSAVFSIVVSRDGTKALLGQEDGIVRVWDLVLGREVGRLEGHVNLVFQVAVAPDGTWGVSMSTDETARVWDLSSGKEVKRLEKPIRMDTSLVTVSPDGRQIVFGCGDGTVLVWDLESDKEVRRLEGHANIISSIAFSPDGKLGMSGSSDGTVLVWDLDSNREVKCFKGPTTKNLGANNYPVYAFSSDGSPTLLGSNGSTVALWDIELGKEVWRLGEPTDEKYEVWTFGADFQMYFVTVKSVSVAAVSPDGRNAVLGFRDGTVRVLELSSGHCIGVFPAAERVSHCAVGIGGRIICVDSLGNVYILKQEHLRPADSS